MPDLRDARMDGPHTARVPCERRTGGMGAGRGSVAQDGIHLERGILDGGRARRGPAGGHTEALPYD